MESIHIMIDLTCWAEDFARRFPGEGNGNPLQYSRLGNPMDRGFLAGYRPWGHKDSDMTEQLTHTKVL